VKLPAYVPDVAAGASAPVQLTEWKIDALRLLVLLEKNGRVTRADFKHLAMDHRRWVAPFPGWLKPDGKGGYIAGGLPPFREQHVKVYAEIKADFAKWAPKDGGGGGTLPL
jgi:hypothetical protein